MERNRNMKKKTKKTTKLNRKIKNNNNLKFKEIGILIEYDGLLKDYIEFYDLVNEIKFALHGNFSVEKRNFGIGDVLTVLRELKFDYLKIIKMKNQDIIFFYKNKVKPLIIEYTNIQVEKNNKKNITKEKIIEYLQTKLPEYIFEYQIKEAG